MTHLKQPLAANPKDAGSPPVDSDAYRAGMRMMPAAVSIVTTDGVAGRAGFTATAVTSVSDSPPTLLVCLNATGSSFPVVTANGRFCVNVLAEPERALADTFSGRTDLGPDERFASGDWLFSDHRAPVLATGCVAFACEITDTVIAATHAVLFGQVVGIHRPDGGAPLLYHDRTYRTLGTRLT